MQCTERDPQRNAERQVTEAVHRVLDKKGLLQILAVPFTFCELLGKSFNSHLSNNDNTSCNSQIFCNNHMG